MAPKIATEELPGLVKHSPLKYFTVLTLSSSVASSSHTNTVLGCCWKADTVHMWLTPSSMALYKAKALWAPVIRIITCTPRHREGQSGPGIGVRGSPTTPCQAENGDTPVTLPTATSLCRCCSGCFSSQRNHSLLGHCNDPLGTLTFNKCRSRTDSSKSGPTVFMAC